MARFGPILSGGFDPRDLLDILALTGPPKDANLALSQTLKLLPRVSSARTVGGILTYPEGGYEESARKRSFDSLLLTELAWPEEGFLHRVFNHEALYYGRERPRERRRELAYLVAQLGRMIYHREAGRVDEEKALVGVLKGSLKHEGALRLRVEILRNRSL